MLEQAGEFVIEVYGDSKVNIFIPVCCIKERTFSSGDCEWKDLCLWGVELDCLADSGFLQQTLKPAFLWQIRDNLW